MSLLLLRAWWLVGLTLAMAKDRPVLGFRSLSPEAHQAVLDRAALVGLSMSDYLRRVIASDLEGSGGLQGGSAPLALGLGERSSTVPASRLPEEERSG